MAKLFLLFYVWSFIAISVFFILKSRKIYFDLKKFERICVQRKREVVRNFLPLVFNLAKKNESFKIILKILSYQYFLIFFQSFIFYKWAKTGFNVTRRALR